MMVAAVFALCRRQRKRNQLIPLSHIFEPFYTTKGTVGTGLGLWVSKQIVDNHAGKIRVRSSTREGQSGTVICVMLPFETEKAPLNLSAHA